MNSSSTLPLHAGLPRRRLGADFAALRRGRAALGRVPAMRTRDRAAALLASLAPVRRSVSCFAVLVFRAAASALRAASAFFRSFGFRPTCLSAVFAAALVVTLAASAEARINGMSSHGCDGCHASDDTPPTLEIEMPDSISPGQRVPMALTVSGGGVAGAGYFLTTQSGEGTFEPGSGSKLSGGGLTHTVRKAASGGVVRFDFFWTAPNTPQATRFQVSAIASDNNGSRSGDRGADIDVDVAYGCTGVTLYRDWDQDGFGWAGWPQLKCGMPEGFAGNPDDCNDNNADVHPGAMEQCNQRDDNCNDDIDEGTQQLTFYPDADGDGHGVPGDGQTFSGCALREGLAPNADDCDDANPLSYPGAVELCNGVDDNCNAVADEGLLVECGLGECRRTTDSCFDHDCIPGLPGPEVCNGLDDDCDGFIDDGNALCGAGEVCGMTGCIPDPNLSPGAAPDSDAGAAAEPSPVTPGGSAGGEPGGEPSDDPVDAPGATPSTDDPSDGASGDSDGDSTGDSAGGDDGDSDDTSDDPADDSNAADDSGSNDSADGGSSGCSISGTDSGGSYPATAWSALLLGLFLGLRRRAVIVTRRSQKLRGVGTKSRRSQSTGVGMLVRASAVGLSAFGLAAVALTAVSCASDSSESSSDDAAVETDDDADDAADDTGDTDDADDSSDGSDDSATDDSAADDADGADNPTDDTDGEPTGSGEPGDTLVPPGVDLGTEPLPDGGVCMNACDDSALPVCADGHVRSCWKPLDGCTILNAADCRLGTCADELSCADCNDECERDGQTGCRDGTLGTCVRDENNCLRWEVSSECDSGFCTDELECGSCPDECALSDDPVCADGKLSRCFTDAYGCRRWSEPSPCALGYCGHSAACPSGWAIGQRGGEADDRFTALALGVDDSVAAAGGYYDFADFEAEANTTDAYLTVKDNQDRVLVTERWGSPLNDEAVAVGTIRADQWYVAGWTEAAIGRTAHRGGRDGFVTLWEVNGQGLPEITWTRLWGSDQHDLPRALAVTPNGDAVVVGSTTGTLSGQTALGDQDLMLVRYDAVGNRLHLRQWGTSEADLATDVVAADDGSVFVVGRTAGDLGGAGNAGASDAFLQRIDSAGEVVFTSTWGGASGDAAETATLARNGDVIVIGTTQGTLPGEQSAGGIDLFISRFSPDGTQLWERQWGTTSDDRAYDVTLDDSGRIYAAAAIRSGEVDCPLGQAWLLVWDADGTPVHQNVWDSCESDEFRAVAVDSNQRVSLAGATRGDFVGTSRGGTDAIIVTYNPPF